MRSPVKEYRSPVWWKRWQNEVTIVTAVHNIKSNKGSRTAGVDKIKMDKYLQMPKDELYFIDSIEFSQLPPQTSPP